MSTEADFVICGEINADDVKPEGPFGDHLGYYSLTHDFPVMRVHKVYAKKDAIWPFTVVGRPPQEDSQFGALIHEITDSIIPSEIPGIIAVNAVDEAGVHPLLLAIGSERYTPYNPERKPQELLTLSNHVLGKGQLSLAKYLMMVAHEDDPKLNVNDKESFSNIYWSALIGKEICIFKLKRPSIHWIIVHAEVSTQDLKLFLSQRVQKEN